MSAARSIRASSNSSSTASPAVPRRQPRASLSSTSANGLGLVVAHRHQPVAGQNEGDRREPRRDWCRRRTSARRHVAGAVLDIEAAGDLDLLHVFPCRHLDPGQPFHRAILLRWSACRGRSTPRPPGTPSRLCRRLASARHSAGEKNASMDSSGNHRDRTRCGGTRPLMQCRNPRPFGNTGVAEQANLRRRGGHDMALASGSATGAARRLSGRNFCGINHTAGVLRRRRDQALESTGDFGDNKPVES